MVSFNKPLNFGNVPRRKADDIINRLLHAMFNYYLFFFTCSDMYLSMSKSVFSCMGYAGFMNADTVNMLK